MQLTNISINKFSTTLCMRKVVLNKSANCGFIIFSLLGWLDSVYLTVKHYAGQPVICSLLNGCSDVLTSRYSILLGLPTAFWGAIYYFILLVSALLYLRNQTRAAGCLLMYFTWIGLIISSWLIYLQIAIIHSLCLYCLISAGTSLALFILSLTLLLKYQKK